MEGGALVAGDQDGLQGLGQAPRPLRRGDVVGQAGGDEVAARRGEAAGVERRALDAALDGGPARPAGLDLQEAGAGVEVTAGANGNGSFIGKSSNRDCPKLPNNLTFLSVVISPIIAAFLPNSWE